MLQSFGTYVLVYATYCNCNYRAVLDIQMALCVFGEVYANLWPQDPTPRLLTRLLVEYEFGATTGESEKERCR